MALRGPRQHRALACAPHLPSRPLCAGPARALPRATVFWDTGGRSPVQALSVSAGETPCLAAPWGKGPQQEVLRVEEMRCPRRAGAERRGEGGLPALAGPWDIVFVLRNKFVTLSS